jgi:hypothetical protein
VAATLYDDPQIVLAGEIDRGDHVIGRLGGHGIDAWPQRPGIHPAERLRQPDLVAGTAPHWAASGQAVGVEIAGHDMLPDYGARRILAEE